MARRSATRTRRVPRGATTVHIPRQRGRRGRRSVPQVLLVVPEHRPSLLGQAAAAGARGAWKRRRTWAPTWTALAVLAATAAVHLWIPWLWIPLAILAASGPAVVVWLHYRRPADRTATWWRIGTATAMALGCGWLAAGLALGPLAAGLPVAWLVFTIAAQTVWSRLLRLTGAREGARP